MDTWKIYVRRKYKIALDKWNKETGGGNGQLWSFVNYCEDARWLVVVFLKDVEANYLLASNAGGRMPGHLQMECRIEAPQDISSLEDSDQSKSNAKRKALIEADKDTKKMKTKFDGILTIVSTMCKERKASNDSENLMSSKNSIFENITQINQALKDNETLAAMSPNTRENYVNLLQAERKEYIERMLEKRTKQKSGKQAHN